MKWVLWYDACDRGRFMLCYDATTTFRLRNGHGICKFFSTTLLRHKFGKTKPMLGKKAYP